MSDNFNNIMDNIIRFIAGERPSADKFNALVAYFSQNSQELNNALGDIRGENNPFGNTNRLTLPWGRQIVSDEPLAIGTINSDKGRYLDIANIGRLIGPSSNLNNRYLSSGSFKIENESIFSSKTEYKTNFPIEDISNVTIKKDGAELIRVNANAIFNNTNEYKYDERSFIFSSPTNENTTISYTTNPGEYGSGANYQGSRFNVIPDPNDPNKLIITPSAGGYTIEFPEIGAAQSNLNNDVSTSLNNDHVNHTKQNGDVRQKYLLPKVLTDPLVDANNPEDAKIDNQIPKYFLYLKCENTEEVFLDADYYYMNESKIYVENIDLGNCDLNNDIFKIVTVGTDITTSIDDLRVKFIKHKHDGTFGEEAIDVKDLIGLFDNYSVDNNGNYLSNVYTKSRFSRNPFSTYLHRDGYEASELENINANNAMRGHLVISNTSGTDTKPNSASGQSFKLAFGLPSNAGSVDVYEIDELLHAKTAHLMLASSENLRIASATQKGIESYFEDIYSIYGLAGNAFTNRMQLKANDLFVEEDVKHLLSVSADGNLSEKKIVSFTKTIDDNNDREITSIVEKTDYKVTSSKHTAILADVFELGPKVNLNLDDHLNNGDVGDGLGPYKTRQEKGLLYDSGKENILSGGLLNPEATSPPTKTFLNINADLYRRERETFSIGYNQYQLPTIDVFDSNGNAIPGYYVGHTNCDITIGNWSNLTNRDGNTGVPDGSAINIYLDFKYEAGNRSNYLKNNYGGTEFNINILIGETIPGEGNAYLNIISLGDSIYSTNNIAKLRNNTTFDSAVTLVRSNNSFYQNEQWNVSGNGFNAGGVNSDADYKERKYISLRLRGYEDGGLLADTADFIENGSILNLKGTLFSNPVLQSVGANKVSNDPYLIPNKELQPLTYEVVTSGRLIY